jgi:predicted transcriptional regulator
VDSDEKLPGHAPNHRRECEAAFDTALDAAAAADDGRQTPAVVSFESADGVRRLLTDRRLELLRSLMREPAESISDLAQRLERNYATVHEDVEILADAGVVEFRASGQSKAPFVPYETVEFDVTVRAVSGDDGREASA